MNSHTRVVPIHSIKARCQYYHIQLMLLPIRSPDPFLCHLRDGCLFQIYYIHVLTVELLKVPTITQRPPRIIITRRQFPRLFRIFHDLRDLPPDKVTRRLVRFFIVCDITERPEHEPEPVPLIPILLEDAFSLLRRHRHGGNGALLEPECRDGVSNLVEDLVIVLVDIPSVFLAHRSIPAGDAVLWMPLETSQRLDSFRNIGDDLDTGRATPNDARSLAGEVKALRPFACVVHLALVSVDAFDIWIILL